MSCLPDPPPPLNIAGTKCRELQSRDSPTLRVVHVLVRQQIGGGGGGGYADTSLVQVGLCSAVVLYDLIDPRGNHHGFSMRLDLHLDKGGEAGIHC